MAKEINVLGFSSCNLPGCDCGCRVVLGVRHEEARRLYQVLEREGFRFESVHVRPEQADKVTRVEPFTETARVDWEEYCAGQPVGRE